MALHVGDIGKTLRFDMCADELLDLSAVVDPEIRVRYSDGSEETISGANVTIQSQVTANALVHWVTEADELKVQGPIYMRVYVRLPPETEKRGFEPAYDTINPAIG